MQALTEKVREAGIKLKLDKNMLVIIIHGQDNVKRLFSGCPSEVTFGIKLPEETPTTRIASIVYQN